MDLEEKNYIIVGDMMAVLRIYGVGIISYFIVVIEELVVDSTL